MYREMDRKTDNQICMGSTKSNFVLLMTHETFMTAHRKMSAHIGFKETT